MIQKEKPKAKSKSKFNYYICEKCGKKGAYLYLPPVRVRTARGPAEEYCKECNPRKSVIKVTAPVATKGMVARLLGLFKG